MLDPSTDLQPKLSIKLNISLSMDFVLEAIKPTKDAPMPSPPAPSPPHTILV